MDWNESARQRGELTMVCGIHDIDVPQFVFGHIKEEIFKLGWAAAIEYDNTHTHKIPAMRKSLERCQFIHR